LISSIEEACGSGLSSDLTGTTYGAGEYFIGRATGREDSAFTMAVAGTSLLEAATSCASDKTAEQTPR